MYGNRKSYELLQISILTPLRECMHPVILITMTINFNTHSLAGVYEKALSDAPVNNFNTHSLAGVYGLQLQFPGILHFNTHSLAGVYDCNQETM